MRDPLADTQLDHTIIETRTPRISARPLCPPAAPALPATLATARSVRPAPAPAALVDDGESADTVALLCLSAAAGLGFSGVVVASMGLAAFFAWLPAPAAALFGLGGLLLGIAGSACFAALRLRYSTPTRYRSRKTVVARAR
jgi:hypothetical protein